VDTSECGAEGPAPRAQPHGQAVRRRVHDRTAARLGGADYEQAETGVAQAKAQLVQAEAAVEVIEVNLTEALIHAPMDGVVSVKYADPGPMVSATTKIVRIIPMKELNSSCRFRGLISTCSSPARLW
jgi:multidrug resistance efflux pump